jgi:hypothetical protein
MTTATVMTAREVAQQIKFRACLATAVLHKARNKVKDQIRAEGRKVHLHKLNLPRLCSSVEPRHGPQVFVLVLHLSRQSNGHRQRDLFATASRGIALLVLLWLANHSCAGLWFCFQKVLREFC